MLAQVKDLCDKLHDRYDSSILSDYKDIGYIFIQKAEENKNTLKGNKTLISLINNLKIQPPIVSYITGPSRMVKYESKRFDKVIYLFSEDDHSIHTSCPTWVKKLQSHSRITTYLENIFKSTTKFIDFFIEIPFMSKYTYTIGENNTLFEIEQHFFGCLYNQTCPDTVRIHRIDIRKMHSKYKEIELVSMALHLHYIYGYKITEQKVIRDFVIKHRKIIKKLVTMKSMDEVLVLIAKEIMGHKLLMKEITKSTLMKSYTPKQLIELIIRSDMFREQVNSLFSITKTFLSNLLNNTKQYTWHDMEIPTGVLLGLTTIVMDVYTISRMFKIFNVKKNEYQPTEPRNIIYYAGDYHVLILENVLKTLGFSKTESSSVSGVLSCVDMKGIKQPLFG